LPVETFVTVILELLDTPEKVSELWMNGFKGDSQGINVDRLLH
jgi:hypothetical protein